MARNMYGATSADFTVTAAGRVVTDAAILAAVGAIVNPE